jgi:phosphoglycerate dehydrogenase-like enzyme
MAFKLLLLRGNRHETSIIDRLVPAVAALGQDIEVFVAGSDAEAAPFIGRADAAFGYISPELVRQGKNLRWIACPQAGPAPSFFHPELVAAPAVVTNVRGIFSDHISAHVMSYVLAFSRGLHLYMDAQRERRWAPHQRTVYLPEATIAIIGVGAIGAQTAQRCAEFSMHVIGVDPRLSEAPDGVHELLAPAQMMSAVARADFVVATVPETPVTQGMFDAEFFSRMDPGAFFINIGRGPTVRLDALNDALRQGQIAGAALDVFEIEPLPTEHPLWDAPGMIITPHVATVGPYLDDRRVEVFVENCRRFASGQPLLNVVDKTTWH